MKGKTEKMTPRSIPSFSCHRSPWCEKLEFPWHIYLLDLPKLYWADALFLCRDHEVHGSFLLLCDVVIQTQAFGKSCREDFRVGLSKAEIKLVLKVFHGFRTGAALRQLGPNGTISWSAFRLSVPWEVLKEELPLRQQQSKEIKKKQLDELDWISHIII